MWLNLLSILMLVLITFFLALQGTFSAMIMLVLSVISAAVAFGFYEDLYTGLVAQWLPGEGEAVSLMALFLITLLVLRLAVDMAIKGNVVLPTRIDRTGGGVLGFVAGMMMTGVAMTGVQLLPFDHEVLGFARNESVGGKLATNGLFLGTDRFAVGFARILLDGSLSGKSVQEGQFEEVHPDYLGQVDARRSAGPLTNGANEASLAVEQMWWPDRIGSDAPQSGKFLGVRVKPSGIRAWTPAQFRLVVYEGGRLQQFVPVAAGAGDDLARVEPLQRFGPPKVLDLVFEVPANVTAPWYVSYNSWAKAEIGETKAKEAAAPPMAAPGEDAPKEPAKPKPQASSGRTHGADVTEDPVVRVELPYGITIPRSELNDIETRGRSLVNGHVVLPTAKLEKSGITVGGITRFEVPRDMRLVQVPLHRLMPGSLAGQAIDFTLRTLQQQWVLEDDAGQRYMPVGALAIAKVGGQEFLEIQYHASQENITAGHTLAGWRRIQDNDLKQQPDAKLVFLYFVPPGKKIVKFDTGRGEQDLNLDVK